MSDQAISEVPRSRRERPAKSPLTREGIIDVALGILEREGLSKVTMRRIAADLDTGPASLYVYVRNAEDLHVQILDALLGRMAMLPVEGSWRERLHGVLGGYGTILLQYPEIARMTMTTHPIGANYFQLVETILGLLSEGGVSDGSAAWGVDLLLASVTATAVEHGTAHSTGKDAESLSVLAVGIAVTSHERYPRIVRLGDEMLSGTGLERFTWGIDVLVNGLLNTPRSAGEVQT